ncbi:hypothetical protein J41TS4_05420 [Paenibacillus apis]|uniref:Uncharacterized protein n=1 Tax=Paenibacillus apis TaxID=1792174 RepID=A0A919XZ86_9BACL|nr:hypothetical protein J41TS4_05420 [Paenibacillus apis]
MNEFLKEHTLLVDIIGLISYIVLGLFLKVSERRIHNLISASSVTILGLVLWLLIFLIYILNMNNGKEFSFVGPEVIWLFYLPYVHGSYYISLQMGNFNNGYLFGCILLLNNFAITLLIYLTIKIKHRLKNNKVRASQGPFG